MITKRDAFFSAVELIRDEEKLRIFTDKHLAYMRVAFNWAHFTFDHLKTMNDRVDYIRGVYESREFDGTMRNITDLNTRLEFLKNSEYDIIAGTQPEAIICNFDEVKNEDDAMKVADLFMKKYGDTIICIEASYCDNRLQTIIDCLHDKLKIDYQTLQTNIIDVRDPALIGDVRDELLMLIDYGFKDFRRDQLLLGAFIERGFKRASKCDSRDLIRLFREHNVCVKDFDITYDYVQMKLDNICLREELIAYLHHPSRIEKWISKGNALEDYLV
jgi:hypothetical protein